MSEAKREKWTPLKREDLLGEVFTFRADLRGWAGRLGGPPTGLSVCVPTFYLGLPSGFQRGSASAISWLRVFQLGDEVAEAAAWLSNQGW